MKTSSANVYSRDYLSKQKLAVCHLSKLKFDSQVISSCARVALAKPDREWNQYLEGLGITSKQGIKLVTEAALLGEAIEHGLSPDLIILSDGAIAVCDFNPCFVLGTVLLIFNQEVLNDNLYTRDVVIFMKVPFYDNFITPFIT